MAQELDLNNIVIEDNTNGSIDTGITLSSPKKQEATKEYMIDGQKVIMTPSSYAKIEQWKSDNPNANSSDIKNIAFQEAGITPPATTVDVQQQVLNAKNDVVSKQWEIKQDFINSIKNDTTLSPQEKYDAISGKMKEGKKTTAIPASESLNDIMMKIQAPIAGARRLTLGGAVLAENTINYLRGAFRLELKDTEKQAMMQNEDFIRQALIKSGYRQEYDELNLLKSKEFQAKYQDKTPEEMWFYASKEINDKLPFINPATVGELAITAPALATKFMATSTGVSAFLTELGKGSSGGEATATGVATAIGAKTLDALAFIIKDKKALTNIFTGKATVGQTYDYLISKTGSTEKQISEYNDAYAKAVGKDINQLTTMDKIDAILQNSPVGDKYKASAEFWGDDVINKMIKDEEIIAEKIDQKLIGGEISRTDFLEAGKSAKNLYKQTEQLITSKFDVGNVVLNRTKVDSLISVLDNLTAIQTKVDINAIKNNLIKYSENPTSLENLITLKKDINSIDVKGVNIVQSDMLKKFVDNSIDEIMKKNPDYKLGKTLWEDANKQYAIMKIAEDPQNPMGQLLKSFGEKRISAQDIASRMLSIGDRGAANFNEIHALLGEEASAKLEKAVIREALKGKKNMSQAFDYIQGFEFASQEGMDFVKEVKRLKGIVPDKEATHILNSFTAGEYRSEVGWSDDLVAKMKIKIVQKIWSGLMSRLPEAEGERAFRTLADVIKKTDYNNVKIDVKSDPELQQLFLDEQKATLDKIASLKAQAGTQNLRQDLLARLNKDIYELVKKEKAIKKVIDKNVISQEQVNALKKGELFPQTPLENKVPVIQFTGKQGTVFGNEIPPANEALAYIAKIKDPAKQTEAYVEYFSKTQGDTGGSRATDFLKRKFNSTTEKTNMINDEISAKESMIKNLEQQPKSAFVTNKLNQLRTDIYALEKEMGGSGKGKLIEQPQVLPKRQAPTTPSGLSPEQQTRVTEYQNQIDAINKQIAIRENAIKANEKANISDSKKQARQAQYERELNGLEQSKQTIMAKMPKQAVATKELP